MCPEDSGGDGAPEPEDAQSGPPPDPLDRPWVHPSELRSFVSAPSSPTREPRPREWAIGISSAVVAVVAWLTAYALLPKPQHVPRSPDEGARAEECVAECAPV